MIGFVAKLKLGTGPVIKTTSLNLANLVKTYGDEPFLLKPISNSAAPVRYAVTTSGSSCATVHPTTGLVKLTCGTPFGYVQIMAIQDAVSGYTADTAYAQIKINRAIPTIVFPNQGGVYVSGPDKDTITLSYSSNSDGYFYFNKMTFDTVISQSGESNVVAITGIGESIVRLTYDQTDNYESHYVEAKVLGSIVLKAPEANEDNAVMIYGQQTKITFNVLSNDESYAGSLEASLIDLDPSTQEIDHIYLSSSLGYFEADTTGLITYIPFSGFIGSGFITYTIRDSKGSVSAPAKIAVEVTLQGEAPALRATELITPNNDGLNDAFVIGNIVLGKTNQLKIFDRNGAELFTKNDYANDWRGELSNGKQVENGIYYYLFVEGDVGNQRELKGVVELRR
jgi:gliding motility-associated-like protein